jgi:hypothetical protein
MANSLATATNSRVDSASKHIVPCKVNTDYLTSIMNMSHSDSTRELQVNKMKYCVHKDDVVIGLGRATYGASVNSCYKKAYPSVISTISGMNMHVRQWIAMTNFRTEELSDIPDMLENLEALCTQAKAMKSTVPPLPTQAAIAAFKPTNDQLEALKPSCASIIKELTGMLDFHFVGISLGTAYAHSHSGDTVCSVMVGGLKTVLNGAFQVHTNDLLMFYFDEEMQYYEHGGGRKERINQRNVNGKLLIDVQMLQTLNGEPHPNGPGAVVEDVQDRKRRKYNDQQQGTYPGNLSCFS